MDLATLEGNSEHHTEAPALNHSLPSCCVNLNEARKVILPLAGQY